MDEKRTTEEVNQIKKLSAQVMKLSHDDLLMHLRFLDMALAKLELRQQFGMDTIATDGQYLFYDPIYVLKQYRQNPHLVSRGYLHGLLHCIFVHRFGYDKLDEQLWNLAADLAVEAVVLELDLPGLELESDGELAAVLKVLREDAGGLHAEKLYRLFRRDGISPVRERELRRLSCRDDHSRWREMEKLEITEEQWQELSRRIRAELKSFTAQKGGEALAESLDAAIKAKTDYRALLDRFTTMGETIRTNEDEFDYVYYTYGLQLYGNLPLVEPLEYREEKRVREFVIALDTSASCKGDVVKNFLRKTISLLRCKESFFDRVNIHIMQCDSQVQSDARITNEDDLELFLKEGKLTGFGATDFRPVFDRVEELMAMGEFENLRGLIYFSDGYGVYPEKMPEYPVLFAFLNGDEYRPAVPHWAMQAVLEEDELWTSEEQKNI